MHCGQGAYPLVSAMPSGITGLGDDGLFVGKGQRMIQIELNNSEHKLMLSLYSSHTYKRMNVIHSEVDNIISHFIR